MGRFQHHAPAKMTRTHNRTAFSCWLHGCTDDALAKADIMSLSRSYGLPVEQVNSEILRQRLVRRSNG